MLVQYAEPQNANPHSNAAKHTHVECSAHVLHYVHAMCILYLPKMCLHSQSSEQHHPIMPCCLAGAGTEAFCSGGDQSVRGKGGYVGADGVPRLNVLDLQVS